MLYRKTATAFSAVILGVLALLGDSAQAQMNLDAAGTVASPVGAMTFSRETLPALTGRETYHAIKPHSGSDVNFAMKATLGYPYNAGANTAVPLGEGPAIRIDLQNLEFNTQILVGDFIIRRAGSAPGTGALDTTAVPRRIVYGGTGAPGAEARCPGDTCVILELGTNAATALAANDDIEMWFWYGKLRVSPEGGGQIRLSHYISSVAAVTGDTDDGLRKTTGWKTVVNVASSITTRFAPGTAAVSNVGATPRFTNFIPAGTRPLGSIAIALNTNHHRAWVSDAESGVANSTGLVRNLDDVRGGGNIGLTSSTGSLAFATFDLRTSNECPAAGRAGVTVAAEGDNAGRGTAALFTGTKHLCVTPRRSGIPATAPNFEIPVASVTAAVNYDARPNYRFGPTDANGVVGNIVRNGATVNLGYLTTSDRYNQRIIITNRGGVPAEYELSDFYTEMGTEATAGDAAMGTVPAEMSVVILTRDAVSFTGPRNRASATLTVTAPASVIDVATTQVNNMDGSTDTVNYEVLGVGG